MVSVEERFWSKVEKTDTCWLWTGQIGNHGYGVFWDGEKQVLAHRWAVGTIGDGLTVDHLCRTKPCVRGDHLETVSQRENLLRAIPYRVKTHCANGHEYTPENTAYEKTGARRCKECSRLKSRRYKSRT